MDEVYLWTRAFYFMWGFGLFLSMIHWGLQDLILSRRCGHMQLPPECYFFSTAAFAAVFVLLASLGEIFFQEVMGGFRVFLPILFLLPASIAVQQGAYRIKMHREMIRRGLCS